MGSQTVSQGALCEKVHCNNKNAAKIRNENRREQQPLRRFASHINKIALDSRFGHVSINHNPYDPGPLG